ncbi:isoamylase early set domain-containing protein [Rhodohalobacter mucosus]|uniref:AMP-activated protein kinase glycogen-binding domain-containing protein n=1 Tax=Rhodohalobacter mucosus TaxID=2079485 RepID=A0A316TSP9_9BACT|nr:isoamylase early set domain-containing protein [Rhodohalobacter mucosus]PWN05284.1 hypothetical protein DDZ15_14495 [Rhodohalobacter mucosus]
MMNENSYQFDRQEELFRRYLDGELSSGEEREALHMIADSEEMREMLRFERSLSMGFLQMQDPGSFTVPDNFKDSVMNRIEQAESAPEKTEISKNKSAEPLSIFRKRTVTFHPVLAAAAMILISFGFGYLLFTQMQPAAGEGFDGERQTEIQTISGSEAESQIWIRFVYFDESAETIEVAGDFNDWEPTELSREIMDGRQVWTGMIPVTRGEHKYMFVKDGEEWVTDPLAEVQQDDGFGNKNAVLYL